jgi:hypothetical protein
MDVFQSVWFRLIYLLSLAVYITVLWFVLGPASRVAGAGTPWYGVSVAWVTCGLVVAVPSPAVMRRVPCQWFRVPAREHLVHRMLGVGAFGWLRAAAVSHGICFAIHVLLAVLALFSRHPWTAALWMLLPGVVVHLYPVLLQRSIMLRLQPLLHKTGSAD